MSSSIRALALVFTIAVSSYQAAATEMRSGTLVLDPSKTLIEFRLPGSIHTTHGVFKLEHGTIRANLDTEEASGSIVVDAKSGDSGIGARDDRMRDTVLEVQKYPKITFEARHATGQLGKDGQFHARLQGVLNLHGAERQLVIDVQGRLAGDTLVAKHIFQCLTSNGVWKIPAFYSLPSPRKSISTSPQKGMSSGQVSLSDIPLSETGETARFG
jgi:polyisoprenoid-binding protein YceI